MILGEGPLRLYNDTLKDTGYVVSGKSGVTNDEL
jgi:hypothetical protein